ncbi:hypothetical protein JCM8097_000087 [Rhodosporidiobolus ruineniae]
MHSAPRPPVRLVALLVLVLALAQLPQPASAALDRVPKHRRSPSPAPAPAPTLEPRQGGAFLDQIFGGASSTDTTAASDAASAASSGASGTGASASASSGGISLPGLGASSAASSASSAAVSSASLPSSASSAAPSSTSSAPSSISSAPSSSESSSSSKSASQVIVTVTSIQTNADGSESTMLSQSASAVADKGGSSSGPSGKTWGIIGGVIGGVVVLVGIILVVWRCTQRRFSDLDYTKDELRWPELNHDGQTVDPGLSTLNPQGTRRTGGAGFAMEKDRDDDEVGSEWGDSPKVGGGAAVVGVGMHGGNGSEYFEERAPYEVAYAGQPGMGGQRGSYYDPYLGNAPPPAGQEAYLGPSAAPYPAPPNLYPPQPAGAASGSPYMYPDASFSNPHLTYAAGPGGAASEEALTGPQGGIPYRAAAASPRPDQARY